MSKHEMTSGENAPVVVVVEQTPSSRHKPSSYRPTELLEETNPELYHKRVHAPAVPSISSERQIEQTKKLSSTKKRGSSPEDIAMEVLDTQKGNIETLPQPIPDHESVLSKDSTHKVTEKTAEEKKADEDSITEDIAELRTAEPAKDHTGWSDDEGEEASGLPRSESHVSRVSRAMRQLFCCGVSYSPPSEEELSDRREYSGI